MNTNLLYQLFRISSPSRKTEKMQRFLERYALKRGWKAQIKDGNVYVTKGDSLCYPAFVAHTDQQGRGFRKGEMAVITVDGHAFGYNRALHSPEGIGGDDKVGIFLALEALEKLPAAKALFTRDEEIGCDGAEVADLSFFANCGFVLQGDRRGATDVVIQACGDELCSQKFLDAIAGVSLLYGRKNTKGGLMTDVQNLKSRGLDICALNLSCGYYRPHSDEEYVNLSEIDDTLNYMLDLTHVLNTGRRWEHTTPKRTYRSYGAYSHLDHLDDDDAWSYARSQGRHSGTQGTPVTRSSFWEDYQDDEGDTWTWKDGHMDQVTNSWVAGGWVKKFPVQGRLVSITGGNIIDIVDGEVVEGEVTEPEDAHEDSEANPVRTCPSCHRPFVTRGNDWGVWCSSCDDYTVRTQRLRNNMKYWDGLSANQRIGEHNWHLRSAVRPRLPARTKGTA